MYPLSATPEHALIEVRGAIQFTALTGKGEVISGVLVG